MNKTTLRSLTLHPDMQGECDDPLYDALVAIAAKLNRPVDEFTAYYRVSSFGYGAGGGGEYSERHCIEAAILDYGRTRMSVRLNGVESASVMIELCIDDEQNHRPVSGAILRIWTKRQEARYVRQCGRGIQSMINRFLDAQVWRFVGKNVLAAKATLFDIRATLNGVDVADVRKRFNEARQHKVYAPFGDYDADDDPTCPQCGAERTMYDDCAICPNCDREVARSR